jgi:predicted HicB family RNase H-like nuclease
MPKTKQDLSKILQVRISEEGDAAIAAAAEEEHTTVAEWSRRALYEAAGYTKRKRTRG